MGARLSPDADFIGYHTASLQVFHNLRRNATLDNRCLSEVQDCQACYQKLIKFVEMQLRIKVGKFQDGLGNLDKPMR